MARPTPQGGYRKPPVTENIKSWLDNFNWRREHTFKRSTTSEPELLLGDIVDYTFDFRRSEKRLSDLGKLSHVE